MTTATQKSLVSAETHKSAHAASGQILGLDLLRFVASLMVMGFHLGFAIWAGGHTYRADYHYLAPYTWFGWVGVPIFFVLSGFVIAYSAQRSTAPAFAKSRFIRLYPAAWICATLTAIVLSADAGTFHNRFMLKCWLHSVVLWPLSPWVDYAYWTLGIELTFYLLTTLLLLAGWFRHLGAVMTGIAIFGGANLLFATTVQHMSAPHFSLGYRYATFVLESRWSEILLVQHGSLFAIGVLLWLCLFHRVTVARIIGIAASSVGAIIAIQRQNEVVQSIANTHFSLTLPIAIWIVSIAILIVAVKQNGRVSHMLGHRGAKVTRILGLITYPLYLLHQMIGYVFISHLQHHFRDIAALAIVVVLLLSASFFISHYLEKPVQKLVKHLLHASARSIRTPSATLP